MLKPDYLSKDLNKDLKDLGLSKDTIVRSEFYKTPNLLQGFHLRRTRSKLHLNNMSMSKKFFSLFVKYSEKK